MGHRAHQGVASYQCFGYSFVLLLISILGAVVSAPASAQDKDDELVATLAGGRVIIHATQESVTFIALDEPIEAGSAPPRGMSVAGRHVAVLFGSSEWRIPADPNPIRL